jgi:glycerol-3-phosphate acyltransferase PlsY
MSGRDVLGSALAYGVGCLCAGYCVVRWRTGTDVLGIDSSSSGARNAGRVLGHGGFAYDPWIVLVSALVVGLAYLPSGRRLVPSDLAACALAPLTGVLLHRSRVELAVLVALALVILVAHRDNLRAALRPVSATS